MARSSLGLVVFLSGASVMVLELIGSRILAPFVGTSIFVWTSLIGVILASLSLGYWWGGRLSDRRPQRGVLALILFGAAVWIALLAPLGTWVLEGIVRQMSDIRSASVAAALVLFTFPSILMGMVSPYAVRLLMEDVAHSGRTVGALYALSTIGSIVGTFLAGFVLVAVMSNAQALLLVALTLVVTSFLADPHRFRVARAVSSVAVGALLLFGPRGIAASERAEVLDVNTLYSRAWVYDTDITTDTGERAAVRFMRIGNENSGAMMLDYWDLAYPYTKFFRLAHHFQSRTGNVLMIGGGAYAYPVAFLHEHPEGKMDVVEIDPGVTALAREYFFLPDDPRLRIFHEDGRTFLNREQGPYDAILGDAFRSLSYVPHHLVTREAFQHVYDALAEDGVFAANMLGRLEGDGSELLASVMRTLNEVFPHVLAFPVQHPESPGTSQNIMLVALKQEPRSFTSPDPRVQACLDHRWEGTPNREGLLLTDAFAPVDHMVHKASQGEMNLNPFLDQLQQVRRPVPGAR